MNKTVSNIVIVPDSHSKTNKVPVLYLLHGAGGDYTSWLANTPMLKTYADMYNIIIVCPDGGNTSWYYDSPIDKSIKYETYISKELVSYIDKNYNTKTDKSKRAIAGLSMGGHGAFYLAFRHQDIWGAAGSMSGGVDIRPFHDSWDINKRLGDYDLYSQNWEENTVINMTNLLEDSKLKLIFDCGTEDFFYEVNKNLHEKLIEEKIPHDYIERPGGHDWDYWSNAIKYQLVFFNDFFED